jgi:hypothetical protein
VYFVSEFYYVSEFNIFKIELTYACFHVGMNAGLYARVCVVCVRTLPSVRNLTF